MHYLWCISHCGVAAIVFMRTSCPLISDTKENVSVHVIVL